MRNDNASQISDVAKVISDSPWHMEVLRTVRKLELPDWMIGAGFVRNAIWDQLHEFVLFTSLADIDVIYFDPLHTNASLDSDIEYTLDGILPGMPWSVRNQARMHIRNNDRPYTSSEDAIGHWIEVPTCIAVRLERDDTLNVFAPHGLQDLLNLDVRPTPSGIRKPEIYRKRILAKDWQRIWPKLQIHLNECPCNPLPKPIFGVNRQSSVHRKPAVGLII